MSDNKLTNSQNVICAVQFEFIGSNRTFTPGQYRDNIHSLCPSNQCTWKPPQYMNRACYDTDTDRTINDCHWCYLLFFLVKESVLLAETALTGNIVLYSIRYWTRPSP